MLLNTYLIFSLIVVITAKEKANCDLQNNDINSNCFRKEVIATLSHSPNQLAVDRKSNNIYFSFDSGQGEYIPARASIDTQNSTLMVLKGVKDAFAMTSDPRTGEIYFGGSNGIYRYNPRIKKLKRLAVENLDIWWLVIKDVIYFIKFPSLNAYKYQNKSIKAVEQLKSHSIHQFVFDDFGNILFINNTGLYGVPSSIDAKAVLLKDNPRFLGMATDNKGVVYVCSEDGIYVVSKGSLTVNRVVNVQGVLGMAFDKDNNLIYSDSHDIVRLLPVRRDNLYLDDAI